MDGVDLEPAAALACGPVLLTAFSSITTTPRAALAGRAVDLVHCAVDQASGVGCICIVHTSDAQPRASQQDNGASAAASSAGADAAPVAPQAHAAGTDSRQPMHRQGFAAEATAFKHLGTAHRATLLVPTGDNSIAVLRESVQLSHVSDRGGVGHAHHNAGASQGSSTDGSARRGKTARWAGLLRADVQTLIAEWAQAGRPAEAAEAVQRCAASLAGALHSGVV